MLDARLVDAPPRGAVVVTITRTAPVDTAALRRRVLAGELAWATDVYDVEPLPAGDPIRGLRNVVHVPHIAGRTRDTNLRVADLLAADFLAVLAGGTASGALTEAAATVRGGDG
jgi:D-3-phosphoglycerate dehydrogenase